MSRRAWATGLSDDVCKYRSSMINCSCQAIRYFARAYRNPFIAEVRIPHIISPTVEAAPRRATCHVAHRDGRNFRVRLAGAATDDYATTTATTPRRSAAPAIPPTSLSFAAATAANFNGIVALSPRNDTAASDLSRRQKRRRSFRSSPRILEERLLTLHTNRIRRYHILQKFHSSSYIMLLCTIFFQRLQLLIGILIKFEKLHDFFLLNGYRKIRLF